MISSQWARIWEWIGPAVIRGGEHTERSVLTALVHGGMVLWVDGTDVASSQAAIVTCWCDYPAGRIGFALFAGGSHADQWVSRAADDLCAWARDMGCKELRLVGRKGWAKVLGMNAESCTYSRSL